LISLINTFIVPVLIGDSIPLPWRLDSCMEEFCRTMLLLFWLWHKPSDLLQSYTSWTEAFDTYQFSETSSHLISNFIIKLECKDAKDTECNDYNSKSLHAKASTTFHLPNSSEVDVELLREALILDMDLDLALDANVQSLALLDEVLMVSAELLSNITNRISLTKAGECTKKDLPFRGINVIFAGDMAQLCPVNGTALYSHTVINNL
ncbi:hypothetical protein M404DRAFT_67682, partial [Pisolithus tinctorius Marx 270]